MPTRVDHTQRRATIIGGLLTVAARDGLHAVTMRSVADAAGVSLRLVQYYFDDKSALLHAGLLHLEEQSTQRWNQRIAGLPGVPGAREVLETYFDEALPTDLHSRNFHVVFSAYSTLAVTDSALARTPFVDGPRRIQAAITEVLTDARASHQIADHIDPSLEAQRLVAFEHGLGDALIIGLHTVTSARALVRYHLDQLFTDGSSPQSH